MSPRSKIVVMSVMTGVLGLSLVPLASDLEEKIGLDLLFKMRGPRRASSDVVIVTIDKDSAVNLNLPPEPEKWPRSLHASLTDNLARAGAAVIAFDILFDEARSPEYDNLFAKAIRSAGNVVLCECLRKKTVPLINKEGTNTGQVNIESLIPPIPCLAQSATALAPFPLPKVPVRISQYWTIKTGAGDTPTLPVVAFQIFALQVYDEFMGLLKKVDPATAAAIASHKDEILATKGVEKLIRILRDTFKHDNSIAERMLEVLGNSRNQAGDVKQNHLLRSLIKMYGSDDSHYLNFFGPSGTIHRIPYWQLVTPNEDAPTNLRQHDLRGKAVFVGLSERLRPEQKDGFNTVFSQPSGIDLSGVEIAATAFANLLEDMPVRPLGLTYHLLVIFLWGVMLGIWCYVFPPHISAIGVVGISVVYLFAVHFQFKYAGTWFPLAIPLLFQAPFSFFGAVTWKYFDTNKERQNIRKAFGYYLPDKVVDQLVRNLSDIKSHGQIVYGTCLFTDADQYTTLSETMEPSKLHIFMNKYFEALFEPVNRYGGIVAEVFGDGMLAIWATPHPDTALRNQACLAALSIARGVREFNESSDTLRLPTRIGLHSGYMFLGHVGAIDHYEYRPTGDIVNTASRIENLNKLLQTRVLVSEDVLYQLDAFLTREIGKFLFVGKSKPITVYDLICRIEDSDERQRELCANFADALSAYRRRSWEEAIELFRKSAEAADEDGPSSFYRSLCEKYRKDPPGDKWNGVVHLTNK